MTDNDSDTPESKRIIRFFNERTRSLNLKATQVDFYFGEKWIAGQLLRQPCYALAEIQRQLHGSTILKLGARLQGLPKSSCGGVIH
jgi:hypothetical protein